MKKVLFFLISLTAFFPAITEAKYQFNETIFMQLPTQEKDVWVVGHQDNKENGLSVTRYMLQSELGQNWTKMLNINFKDKQHISASTALEAVEQERVLSPEAQSRILSQHINDLVYERSFPTGEHEIVRMIMTKKGLHRVAYIKRSSIDQQERTEWMRRLMSGVIGQ